MASKIQFRDYSSGDCKYTKVLARKLDLALPKEILDIPCVKEEIKRLKLTTWQYSVNGSTREGTFYWNGGENAWKYYEREEMIAVLDGDDETEAIQILKDYLDENEDDYFPEFTDVDDDEDD